MCHFFFDNAAPGIKSSRRTPGAIIFFPSHLSLSLLRYHTDIFFIYLTVNLRKRFSAASTKFPNCFIFFCGTPECHRKWEAPGSCTPEFSIVPLTLPPMESLRGQSSTVIRFIDSSSMSNCKLIHNRRFTSKLVIH